MQESLFKAYSWKGTQYSRIDLKMIGDGEVGHPVVDKKVKVARNIFLREVPYIC